MTPQDFITSNAALMAPPLVPEIKLYLATEVVPLWRATEEELTEIGVPPPYWAFAWAGGQALARYVLDNPLLVAGKRVLDIGAGSGLGGDCRGKIRRGERACGRHRFFLLRRHPAQCRRQSMRRGRIPGRSDRHRRRLGYNPGGRSFLRTAAGGTAVGMARPTRCAGTAGRSRPQLFPQRTGPEARHLQRSNHPRSGRPRDSRNRRLPASGWARRAAGRLSQWQRRNRGVRESWRRTFRKIPPTKGT